MNLLKDLDLGPIETPTLVIEIPRGSRNKYEYDKKTGLFAFDRVISTPMGYPLDYGFFPQTHCDDGDPLDGFVIINEALVQGCTVKVRPIGMIEMVDDGEQDNKLICVADDDRHYAHVKDLSDLPDYLMKEVKYFLEHYKDLRGKEVDVPAIHGCERAVEEVKLSKEMYQKLV